MCKKGIFLMRVLIKTGCPEGLIGNGICGSALQNPTALLDIESGVILCNFVVDLS